MAKQMSLQQYNTLKAGYAEKLGFDLDNMTADQEHELVELMAADGLSLPATKALPASESVPTVHILHTEQKGEINGTISNNGSGDISQVNGSKSASKSSNTKRGRRGAASTASRDSDIHRMLTTTAQEWDHLGNLAADVAAVSYSNAFDSKLTEFIVEALPGSQYTGMSAADFLSKDS